MGFTLGATMNNMNRAVSTDTRGLARLVCFRINPTSFHGGTQSVLATDRAANTRGLRIYFTAGDVMHVVIPGTVTDADFEFDTSPFSGGTEYDFAIVIGANAFTGDENDGTVELYARPTSAGTSGLFDVAYLYSPDTSSAGDGTEVATNLRNWYVGNDEGGSNQLAADIRDFSVHTAAASTSFGTGIEIHGLGGAAMQLFPLSSSVTMRFAPREIAALAYDAVDCVAMTIGGSVVVLGPTGFDGPQYDLQTPNQSAAIKNGIMARYCARLAEGGVIKDSNNKILSYLDLSGGGAHLYQTTVAARATYVASTIKGREGGVHSNQSTATTVNHYLTRTTTGTGYGRQSASGGALSQGGVVMWHAPFVPSSTGYLLRLNNTAGTVDWAVAWGGSNSLGVSIAGGAVGATAGSMIGRSNAAPFLFCHTGAGGANNISRRIDGQSDTYTQTNSNAVRYVHRLGSFTDATPCSGFTMHELYQWTADKTASANTIVDYLKGRWSIPTRVGCMVLAGSSSEADTLSRQNSEASSLTSAIAARAYVHNLTQSDALEIFNFGVGGYCLATIRLAINTVTGSSTFGDTVTQATSGATGKCLAQTSSYILLYDLTGTFDGTNAISSTGFTANVSAAVSIGSGGVGLANTTRLGYMNTQFARWPTGKRALVYQAGSNDIGQQLIPTPADITLTGMQNFVALCRTIFASNLPKFLMRPPQPRATLKSGDDLGGRAVLGAYITAAEASSSTYDRWIGINHDAAMDDYTGTTDTGNGTYYSTNATISEADGVHGNSALHAIIARFVDDAVASMLGIGGSRRKKFLRRVLLPSKKRKAG